MTQAVLLENSSPRPDIAWKLNEGSHEICMDEFSSKTIQLMTPKFKFRKKIDEFSSDTI